MVASRIAILGLVLSFVGAAAPCTSGGSPAVTTDKSDYGPSETVTIAGCGLGFRERLTVLVTAPDGSTRSGAGSESADENGTFALNYRLAGALRGAAYLGQNGNYTVTVRNASGAVVATTVFRRSPETYATCAVTASGGAKCWGYGGHGQLGNGSYFNSSTPVDVSGLTGGVAQISVGLYHACAVTTSGAARCWGSNSHGQLGVDGSSNSPTPVEVNGLASGVAQISAGNSHTCAVMTSGGVKCWGYSRNGALGNSAFNQSNTPVDVSGLSGA